MKLNLKNPIVFFDLETTGTNINTDRIVEICYLKVYPNGNEEAKTLRINPEMHIPEASSAIHGIYDADDYDDHEWPFACNILDWRGFDQRCTGYAGKIHVILGYGCIFLVCNAGCHVVHDAGYDIYYAAAGIGCSEAYFGSIRY